MICEAFPTGLEKSFSYKKLQEAFIQMHRVGGKTRRSRFLKTTFNIYDFKNLGCWRKNIKNVLTKNLLNTLINYSF